MDIVSLKFAVFLVVVLGVYYLLPRRPQNILLLVASYAFCITWSWWYALILLGVTIANYALVQAVAPAPPPMSDPAPPRRGRPPVNPAKRRLLWLGIGLNLAVLVVFKYESFFVPDLRAALDDWGIRSGFGAVDILLPVGISFYIVALISTLVDTYRGQIDPPRDPVDFALFVAYFPKLLAGPIERARDFLPRIQAQRIVDNDMLGRSFTLIVIGMIRKIVVANVLFTVFPQVIWSRPQKFDAPELIGYLLLYAFALYNDFAGYTSMARGVSGLFGIELARNFDLPFFARNFTEFWNRWHITLSHWLRDYIFYPSSRALLRRNPRRDNMLNLLIPPMLTMLISGLWHGTGWTMLLWGALHGVYLIGERLWMLRKSARPVHMIPRWRQVIATCVVFGLVLVAWVPFQAKTVSATFDFWRGMIDITGGLQRPPIQSFIALLPSLWIDSAQYLGKDELVFLRWPRLLQALLLALALLAIFLVSQADISAPFVYQGF